MSEINLSFPEPTQMFTAADNAKGYTFYLVAEKPEYTKRAFEWNPNVAKGEDIYFKSPLTPDKSGRALVDLEPEGKKIGNKLKTQSTPARAVVVATSRPKNRDPRKKQAQVQRVTIHKATKSIKLKPIKDRVTKADWIAHHHCILFVEMIVKGIGSITFETDPKVAWSETPFMVGFIGVQKTPGSGEQVERMILGGVGDRCNNNPKCKLDGPQHENWYPLWSTQMAKKSGPIQVALVPGKENYVVGIYPRYPGTCVLTVKGVGEDAKLCEKIGVSFTGPHSNPGD